MGTYHLDLGDAQTEELDDVIHLLIGEAEHDVDTFVTSDQGSDEPRHGSLVIVRSDERNTAATRWVEAVEDLTTEQDVVIIAGDPASPEARRLHLTKAWAATSFHEDEDEDPEAIALAFADITVK
ncbi:hypothetical protein [Streptomyces sp. TLI_105]|uniref:hypothetical protein n=1 Tax=Streptomyces sp. TLI_105 TaxID=1881019 RepID=UPI0008960F68|nr:hypothetical protein [Streptomyces sp. TLI_105]SEE26272.1 hypothetical protein SAMN05428939_7924 [Streptomyces sp. TLI_105]